MTLGEGKKKVLKLLDEYSSGGELTEDDDIEKKMAAFFDIAQKEMAGYARIIREVTLELDGREGLVEMPEDFRQVFRIWREGRLSTRYAFRGDRLAVREGDTAVITVEYFASPQTIDDTTPDDYEFEVSEEAANCLPFFVAAQQLMADLVVDYSVFWNMYLTMRATLDVSLPSAGSGGVRQALYSRR